MPCHSCGRTDGTMHSGEWIAVKESNKLQEHPTYSDPVEFHLSLCTECLTREALKGTRRTFKIAWIMVLVLTAIGLCGVSGPAADTTVRVIMGTTLALLWIGVSLGYRSTMRRLKRGKLLPSDDTHLTRYARTISAQTGRNVLLTKDAWRNDVEESVRIREAEVERVGRILGLTTKSRMPAHSETVPTPKTSWSEADAVEALISIYTENPDGFAPGYGDPGARAKVREIGEALNSVGGMSLMLRVHSEFQRRTCVYGAPRNLEHTWDGIGEWMG